ncbi:MAG: tetratricopeptide repeat protein [Candidatus Eisenbacteria bacterium]|nr:tetratricopeptide repeat protein [Candidatus Eisenbacteria bacterium]
MRNKAAAAAIGSVLLLALVLRGAYFFSLADHPEFRTPMLDARWFHQQALSILDGRWEGAEAVFRAPLYPLFLAGVYRVLGADPAAARALQLFLGCIAVLLSIRLGGRIFGRTAGLITGVLAAADWIVIHFEGELLIASILPLLATVLLLALLRAERSSRARTSLLAGALLGLFAAARPNVLLFLPAAAFLLGRVERRRGLFLIAGALLLIAPITVRNRIVSGEWILLSSQGGLNFYIGNNREADGMHAAFPGLPSWVNEDVERVTAVRIGHRPSPNETSRYWLGEALREIGGDPVRFAGRFARKAYFLLSSYEVGNNRDLTLFRQSDPVLRLPLLSFGVLLPLALTGMFFRRRSGPGRYLLESYLLFYGASVALFFVCARFRVPLLPALFPLAARGLLVLSAPIRERRFRAAAAPLLFFFALQAGISVDPFHAKRSAVGQDAFHRGNVHARRDEPEKAVAAYREAIERIPDFPGAHYHLGVVLLGMGREEEGIRELEEAMRLDPSNPRVPVGLAEHLASQGERREAERLYRSAIRADPYFPGAVMGLGGLLAEEGRAEEAEPLLRRGLDLAPGEPAALLNLGKFLASTGREEEARPLLERLTRVAPDRKEGWFELGLLLHRGGDPAAAAKAYRNAARLDPADRRSRMNLALALRQIGDGEGAARVLREVIAAHPEDGEARRRLEDLRGEAGD